MNWNEIGTQIILSAAGIIFTALGGFVTYLINKFIKNDEARKIAISLNSLVQNSVLEVYQTFVEALKKDGMFNSESQKQALDKALELIKANMPNNIKTWLETNYSDIEAYLKSLIESQIGLLKNKGGC